MVAHQITPAINIHIHVIAGRTADAALTTSCMRTFMKWGLTLLVTRQAPTHSAVTSALLHAKWSMEISIHVIRPHSMEQLPTSLIILDSWSSLVRGQVLFVDTNVLDSTMAYVFWVWALLQDFRVAVYHDWILYKLSVMLRVCCTSTRGVLVPNSS